MLLFQFSSFAQSNIPSAKIITEDATLDDDYYDEEDDDEDYEEEELPMVEAFDSELDEPEAPTKKKDKDFDFAAKKPTTPSMSGGLPDIEAKAFRVEIHRRSDSLRVYLFKDPSTAITKVGRILLLKRDSENVMAFRVIKTYYPDKEQFAARKVRKYPNYSALDEGDQYLAIEKIADLFPYESIEEIEQDQADLEELEEAEEDDEEELEVEPLPIVQAYDPELDAGTTPPPGDSRVNKVSDLSSIMIEQVKPFETDSQLLSAQVGFLRNSNADGTFGYFSGTGFRYGVNIARMIFLSNSKTQDSFALEGGLFVYKLLNWETANDAYTAIPLHLTVRYNVVFEKTFGLFFYLGVLRNEVVGGSASETALSLLRNTQPAGGMGLMFQMGPKWFIRMDLGFDLATAGLSLRF